MYNKDNLNLENIFGRLKSRFMILKGINTKMETAQKIVIACAVLHNIALDLKEKVWLTLNFIQ